MSGKSRQNDDQYPDWWDESPSKETYNDWQQSVEDYMAFHDIEIEHMKFGVDLVKRLIPHVAVHDKRWKKFPLDFYKSGTYNAHIKLYEAVNSKIISLQTKAKKLKEDAEAAAKAEKARKHHEEMITNED